MLTLNRTRFAAFQSKFCSSKFVDCSDRYLLPFGSRSISACIPSFNLKVDALELERHIKLILKQSKLRELHLIYQLFCHHPPAALVIIQHCLPSSIHQASSTKALSIQDTKSHHVATASTVSTDATHLSSHSSGGPSTTNRRRKPKPQNDRARTIDDTQGNSKTSNDR